MTQELVPVPQVVQAIQIADDAFAIAAAYEIDGPEMCAAAGDELRTIATRRKEIEEARLSLTRPLDESKRRIMELFRGPIEKLESAEKQLRGAVLGYQQAERAKADEARRKAEAEAASERARKERERIAAEDAARRAQEVAAEAATLDDVVATEAAQEAAQEAQQRAEDANVEAELAAVAPAYLPTVVAPKVAGIGSRQNWKAEVIDLPALIKAAAENVELRAFLIPDTKALGQAAKALKANARIPGVRVYAEESLSVRRS